MGVLPLQFAEGVTRQTLKLDGSETFTIHGVGDIRPRQDVEVTLTRADGKRSEEHTSELQSLMRISYAVFCLKKRKNSSAHDYVIWTYSCAEIGRATD